MTYNLQKNFEYNRDNLHAIMLSLDLDPALVDEISLTDILAACKSVYGSASYDESSTVDMSRYSALRRAQMNIRRFWYFYHLLKWRVDNAE